MFIQYKVVCPEATYTQSKTKWTQWAVSMYLCMSIQHLSEHVNVYYNKNQKNSQFESGNVEGVGVKKKKGVGNDVIIL